MSRLEDRRRRLADAAKQTTIPAQSKLGPLAGGMGDALGMRVVALCLKAPSKT